MTVEVDLLGALAAQIRRTTSPEQQARFAASGQADFALASGVAGGVMPTAAGSAQMPLSSKRIKENFLNFDVEGALGDYWPQNRRQNASGATGTSAAAAPTCSSDYPRLSSALPLSTSQRGTMRATAATKQGAIAGADSSVLVNHDMPHWSQRDVVANKSMPDKAELKQKLNQLLPQKHTVDVSELLAASRAQVPQAQYSGSDSASASASVTANVAAAVAVPVTAESFAHPQSVTVANSYSSSSLGAPRTSYPDSKIECFVSMEQHLQHLLTVIQERPQDALAEAVHLCHKLRMNEKQRAQFMGVAQSLIQKHQALHRQQQATATQSQPLQGQAQVSSAVQGTRPNNAFYDAGSGVQLATPTFTGLTPTAMEGANAFAYPNVNLGAGRGPEGVSEQITLASPQERAVAAAISAQSQAHEAWGQDNNAALAYGADAVVDISAVNAAEAQAARAAAQAAAAQAAAQAAAAQAAQTGSASANSADQDTYSGHKKSSSWLNEDPNAFAVFQHGSDIRSDVIDQELARVERRQQELDAAEMQHMQQLLPQMESYFNFLDEISEQLRTEAIKSYKDQERSDSSKKLEDTNTALGKLATPRFRDIKVSEQDLAAEAQAQGAAATASTPAASAAATAAAGVGAVSDVDDVLQQQTTTGYDVNDPRHLGAQMVSSISLAANDPSIDPVDAMKGVPSVGAANAAAAASALQPVSKSDQLAPAVDLGATAAGVAPMPATAAPKAPETLQVVAASAVQPDRCAVDLHAPAAQGDQVVSSAMPAASAAATAPVAAGAASTAGAGAVVSLAPQAHDQSFTAPQGAVQKVDGTVDTTAQDQALAAMAANMAQTHAAKRQARNSQELSALKQQEADAALNALDMMTQHIDEQNHLLEQHGAAAWYAIHDTLAVGNRNLKVHLAKRPKLAVSSVHNFLADSSSDQAPRRIRLFNPPLADNCGMGNVSLVELQQDQQLMAQILSQEQACSENLRLRMAAQTPQHETLAPEQVVVKLRDPQATAAAAQPLATGQLLSIVSMIPHAKLPADLAMRTAQMANNASNAANMALPQGNAQQVVPSRGYQYRGPQLPEVPDYIKEAQESFNDSYGVDAAALPAAPAAPAVAAVAAAPAVAAAENPASQPSPAAPMNAAMDSNAAIAGRVVQAPAAAAAPAPALAGEDQGSDDDDYGANGGGAGFGDAGFGGGGGGAMEGINFDSNEPSDDDDYGGSFSGNVELDLGSSFDEPSGGVIGVPESDLEYEAASEPEEAWAAGGNTGSAVALRSGHWSNISGKKRLNYEDYLPQVAEQDQWYHLIVQAFAETPMLQAMLTNVERVLDPQDANHWILRVDQHEDLSLFSEISAMSLRGGSHNAHGGGLWQMVQERLEAVCGHALRIDIENTDSIPENAPLRLAQRLEEQAKEQARQELSQVQGLTSLLSQLNENMQSVSIEIYQDQVPATVEKKP